MVSVLTNDHVCYHCIIRQKIPLNAYSRSTRVHIIWNKRTLSLESRGQSLNSLEITIFPMNFLETDVVVLCKPREVVVISFPEDCGENGDPISPLVFQETHRRPPSGIWTHVFLSRLVEEHRASNAIIGEQGEHLPRVHHLHLSRNNEKTGLAESSR